MDENIPQMQMFSLSPPRVHICQSYNKSDEVDLNKSQLPQILNNCGGQSAPSDSIGMAHTTKLTPTAHRLARCSLRRPQTAVVECTRVAPRQGAGGYSRENLGRPKDFVQQQDLVKAATVKATQNTKCLVRGKLGTAWATVGDTDGEIENWNWVTLVHWCHAL